MKVTATERAARQYIQNRRRRLQATGQWQDPRVPAAPVRAHVWALRKAGMSEAALVRILGLPDSALKNLMRGANGRPPGTMVMRTTADAVLGYWPKLADFPDTALIDPTGTLRRVHALETLGFSKPWMAIQMGCLHRNFKARLRSTTVSARMARRVAALYDQYWMEKPENHGVRPYVADRVRRYAASQGYHGPLAWEDDTIDDPAALPVTDVSGVVRTEGGNLADRWLLGESVLLDAAARKQVLQHLFEWTNDTPEEIAAKLEMSLDSVWKTWSRLKKKARDEGRREPWRRVYVPRERSLDQADMEEVA